MKDHLKRTKSGPKPFKCESEDSTPAAELSEGQ
jgi:hypothetical protein